MAKVTGTITNETGALLTYYTQKDFAGKNQEPYPTSINKVGTFVHASEDGHADMAAVVFTSGKAVPTSDGWLLAWELPNQDGYINKVLVKSAEARELTNWDVILAELKKSTNISSYVDTTRRVKMQAQITKTGNQAILNTTYQIY